MATLIGLAAGCRQLGRSIIGLAAGCRQLGRSGSRRVLPGFGLSLGYTLTYLTLLVLLPLGACFLKAASLSPGQFWAAVWNERTRAAYGLTLGASLTAAALNAGLGLLVAWVLVRYEFPLKRFFDALVDLPFALPTAVAGLVYSGLYVPEGWLGRFLVPLGIEAAYTRLGIVLVLIFTGFPFVVRTVQPVLAGLEPELEEAAAIMGASRWQTFVRVIWPPLLPPLLTGFALAFARALGEYGSVVFIAGNRPFHTEIAPVLIVARLEEFAYAEATALAVVLLVLSFSVLAVINVLERWSKKYAA
jgi:sulfate transport system permease protein